jgi:hypothetical protein
MADDELRTQFDNIDKGFDNIDKQFTVVVNLIFEMKASLEGKLREVRQMLEHQVEQLDESNAVLERCVTV